MMTTMTEPLCKDFGSMDTTEYNKNSNSSDANKRQKMQDSNRTSVNQEIQLLNQQMNLLNNSFTLIQLKFVNKEVSFNTVSLFDVKDVINSISSSWEFIDFSDDRKCMIFTEKDKLCLNILLNIKQIKIKEENFDVEITKVKNLNKNKGIIFKKQILVLSNDEIKNCLKDQNVSDIIRITKINENGITFDTGSFIIIFNGEVPDFIKLDNFLSIPVNKLKPKPMKCNHCQLIGHTIKRCLKINREMCKNCFQEIVCNIEDHVCVFKCKNCNLNHKSDDKNCPEYKNEIEILEIKSKFGFSYIQAKENLMLRQRGKIQSNSSTNIEQSQLIQDKFDLLLEKHRQLQSTFKKEMKDKKNVEEFVVPELKKKNSNT